MYWLTSKLGVKTSEAPTADAEVLSLALPCPADHLMDLVAAVADGESVFRKEIRLRVRSCPSLMLYALSQYYLACGNSAATPEVLVRWCQQHLLEALLADSEIDAIKGCRFQSMEPAFWESFFDARKRKELIRALRYWLSHQTELTRQEQKRLLTTVVPKGFRPSQFGCRILMRKSIRHTLVSRWRLPEVRDVRLPKLIQLAVAHRASELEISEQLRQDKLAAMKQLAYGASHEINNPLANIAMRAQVLLSRQPEPEDQRPLAMIYRQAMRAHEMISDMMLFANPPKLKLAPFSLRLVLRSFVSRWDEELAQDSITLRINFRTNDDIAKLDQTQFLAALNCLVKNSVEAVRAKPGDGHDIEIRLTTESGWLNVEVIDTGIGVPDSVLPHLFDPFFSGREAGRGLGFGLSKAWRIAEQHGGLIEFDSGSDEVTRFVMRLPLGLDDSGRQRPECKFSGLVDASASRLTKRKSA